MNNILNKIFQSKIYGYVESNIVIILFFFIITAATVTGYIISTNNF